MPHIFLLLFQPSSYYYFEAKELTEILTKPVKKMEELHACRRQCCENITNGKRKILRFSRYVEAKVKLYFR